MTAARASALLVLVAAGLPAQVPVSGIAHVAVRVGDLDVARRFYGGALGFAEPFQFTDGGKTSVAFLKINDRQFIELYPGLKPGQERWLHVCLEVADIERTWRLLDAAGLKPSKVNLGRAGNLLTMFRDPDGNLIEFLQYLPESMHLKAAGQALSDRRISVRLSHAGLPVRDKEKAAGFYAGKLGFLPRRQGSRLFLRIPGANGQSLELVDPAPGGSIGLAVRDLPAAWKTLVSRGALSPGGDVPPADPYGTLIDFAAEGGDPPDRATLRRRRALPPSAESASKQQFARRYFE